MKNLKSFLLIALIAMLASCTKTPTASFTTDKQTYAAGQTITLTNTSTNGDHYLWTMPDGSTSTSENATYATTTCTGGTLNFTLEAYSKSGKKTDQVQKSVTVTHKTGTLSFWTNCSGSGLPVTINGVVKTITHSYPSTPDSCTAYGLAIFTGLNYCQTYHYTANDGAENFDGDVTINSDCNIIDLPVVKGARVSK